MYNTAINGTFLLWFCTRWPTRLLPAPLSCGLWCFLSQQPVIVSLSCQGMKSCDSQMLRAQALPILLPNIQSHLSLLPPPEEQSQGLKGKCWSILEMNLSVAHPASEIPRKNVFPYGWEFIYRPQTLVIPAGAAPERFAWNLFISRFWKEVHLLWTTLEFPCEWFVWN